MEIPAGQCCNFQVLASPYYSFAAALCLISLLILLYVMLTTVHHLLKKILMMRNIVGVTSQLANMGLKCNQLIDDYYPVSSLY